MIRWLRGILLRVLRIDISLVWGISHYLEVVEELTKKDQPFIWNDKCQRAFDTLKQRFTSEPVLLILDVIKPFLIESDASLFSTAAVLQQQDKNGDWKPVAYLSQLFNTAERNYEIYDWELLAIIRALEAWQHYLEGSPHSVQILTDHNYLTFFQSPQRLNRRQARWQLFLSQFNYILEHHAGTKLIQADAMTRMSAPPDAKLDNNEETLLPEEKFIATTLLSDIVFDIPILEIELCGGQLPTRGTEQSAGLDIRSTIDTVILPHQRTPIPTGIKIWPPVGTYCRIAPRSGLAIKDIDVAAGVIDRDYTGEIKAIIVNTNNTPFSIQTGDRIAQLIVEHISYVTPQIVDHLTFTSRNTAGFGSIGINAITTETSIHDNIRRLLSKDPIAQQIIIALTICDRAGSRNIITSQSILPFWSTLLSWQLHNDLLFYQNRCYVPPDKELRREIMKEFHDTPHAGHPRQWRTTELIRREYFWPGLQQFISNYVKGCAHPTTPPL